MLETDLTKIEIKIMKVIWNSPEKLHLRLAFAEDHPMISLNLCSGS